MSKQTYRWIVAFALLPTALATYALGPIFADPLSRLDRDVEALLTLLGWLLAALVAVLGLLVLLWPLRRLIGLPSLAEQLGEIREAGGLRNFAADAVAESERKRAHPDRAERRKYHLGVAAVGAAFSIASFALVWALWEGTWRLRATKSRGG